MVLAGVVGLAHHGLTSGAVLHFIFPGVAVGLIIAVTGLRSRDVPGTELLRDLGAFSALLSPLRCVCF